MVSKTIFILGIVLMVMGFFGLPYTAAPYFIVTALAFIAVAGAEILIEWWKKIRAPTSNTPIECPHCGSDAFLATCGTDIKRVRCKSPDCGAVGGSSPYDEIAIRLWNTRYRE